MSNGDGLVAVAVGELAIGEGLGVLVAFNIGPGVDTTVGVAVELIINGTGVTGRL